MTAPHRQRTVLIVDDIEDNRILLERALASAGYCTVSAESGAAALAVLSSTPIDIVLLDWMMPGLTGLQTLQAIRQDHDSTRLPVIMCTAMGEDDNVVEAIESGANDYVTKPISLSVLRARMSSHLSQCSAVSAMESERVSSNKRMAEQMRRLMESRTS